MQSLFQKTSLTFLIVGMSGWVNIAPAIAQLTHLSEAKPSDNIVEALEPAIEPSSDTPMEGTELEGTPTTHGLDANVADESALDEGASAEDTVTEDTAAENSAEENTIVEVAASSETFTTLVSALSETELAEMLQGDGPFTVFAPTDQAFEALPEGTVEALLAPENKEILVSLLSYHVVPDELMVEDLETGFVDSFQGTPLNVEVGDAVTVNGVSVIDNNISASNGVIHVVDQVILPPQ